MTHAEIPEIRDLPKTVLAGVGEGLQVLIHDTDPDIGPIVRPSHEMVNDVVDDLFRREGVPHNRDLEILCIAAARIAVAKLAASSGFRIEFGDYMERSPREIIDVRLRPEDAPIRQADVTANP